MRQPASASGPTIENHSLESHSISEGDAEICCRQIGIFVGIRYVISGHGVGKQIFIGMSAYNETLIVLGTNGFAAFSHPPPPTVEIML
jgi:hypothetical protein